MTSDGCKSIINQFPKELFLNIHTTESCNLSCRYCYNKVTDIQNPTYHIQDLINFIKHTNCKKLNVIFYGGEPTCNIKYMENVIYELNKIKLDKICYVLQTNGTLLALVPQDLLSNLDVIQISFDGTQQTNDYSRGKGVYSKIVENLNYLSKSYDGIVIAQMTLTKAEDLLADFLETHKLFNYINFHIDSTVPSNYQDIFIKNYKEALKQFINYWIDDLHKKSMRKYVLPFVALHLFDQLPHPNNPYFYCLAGYASMTIDSKGQIFSCPEGSSRSIHFSEINCAMGHISNSNIKPLIHSPMKRCLNCSKYYLCRGRCLWSNANMYCEASHYIIDLVREHKDDLQPFFDPKKIPENLQKAISVIEVMP